MKEKYLLINQHSSNHGDEAAAKAITSKTDFSKKSVSILYNTVNAKAILDLGINFDEILLTKQLSLFEKVILMISFYLPIKVASVFFTKALKNEYLLINKSDKIISMPGGANMGLYNDWRYLWRLFIGIKLKKKVAIYSVSIGPFSNQRFKRLVKYVLNNVDFISLRDAQSFRYGNEMDVNYTHSIDTAFLTQPFIKDFDISNYDIPFEENSFAVVVANNLTAGHLSFTNFGKEKLKKIYVDIVNQILKSDLKIVFLPQLFANGNDKDYFKEIISGLNGDYSKQIFIVDENLSSDIQQNIIKNSKFVVGARYHSIIFSINNNKPFLCLSYENKMKNTLEILGYQDYGMDLVELTKGADLNSFKNQIEVKLLDLINLKLNKINNEKSKSIASKCFKIFESSFLD